MSTPAYIASSKRTFEQAFIHLMEQDYGFLKSKRMLSLMAEDIQRLIEQFYPQSAHVAPGWVIFTGTKAEGSKAYPGQEACDQTLITLAWPLLTSEDRQQMATQPDTQAQRRQLLIRRLIRLLEYGWQHPDGPVLLTQADLSLLFGVTTVEVSHLLKEARQHSGKPLLTKGYFFDQGLLPTHKAEMIALYEQGLDEVEIARRSNHAQSSVGHYLRDYERVKLLVKSGQPLAQIRRLLDLRPSVVDAYLDLLHRYHPALFTNLRSDDGPI
jgi:hypothetical protein